MEEMISSKILRKTEPGFPKRYLPILAVLDLEREITKLRICLDAKSKYDGVSLNDALLKGKYEMNDIYRTLTKFRSGVVALLGDT